MTPSLPALPFSIHALLGLLFATAVSVPASAPAQVGTATSTGSQVTYLSRPVKDYFPSAGISTLPFAHNGALSNRDSLVASAVCAGDERTVFTAARAMIASGKWSNRFAYSAAPDGHQDWNQIRGQWVLSGYGYTASRSYNRDFAALYAYERLGTPAPYWSDGGSALRSNAEKLITGYPSYDPFGIIYPSYQQLHTTRVFQLPFQLHWLPDYHRVSGVAAAPDAMGGPAWVLDRSNPWYPRWKVAGIVLSGDATPRTGVRALDDETHALAQAAARSSRRFTGAVTTRTSRIAGGLTLPDGPWSEPNAGWTMRGFRVNGMPYLTTSVALSLDISTTYRGDLDVYIVSPRGKSRWIVKHNGSDSRDNLVLHRHDCSSSFWFANPNGVWRLYLRDCYRGDIATLNSAELTISAW